jgi:hypothetical protein
VVRGAGPDLPFSLVAEGPRLVGHAGRAEENRP